jgi:hypothetical protein
MALLAGPVAAEEVWVLETGPTLSDTVPLKPAQPVDSWRALYSDGTDGVWLYATQSPNFFAPTVPEVRKIAGTPWTVAVFFPHSWAAARCSAWFDLWQAGFLSVSTFPRPGWPIVFPSVLRPTLSKG